MDALLFMIIALVLVVRQVNDLYEDTGDNVAETITEDVAREAKLNETFYEDLDAFSEIIHALGFPKE